mmetsp:Transcript_42454/g.92302  ORF Transcript_42454/g.92302 Transcript_42454/m.92302 type:complete len:302 (+) Transcript_42454:1203-2108(+)
MWTLHGGHNNPQARQSESNKRFESFMKTVPTLLGGGVTLHNIVAAYELGSTGIPGCSSSSSDLDVVVVVQDGVEQAGKWADVGWLRDHGWVPQPLRPDAYDGFARRYSGSDAHDVWCYTERSFRQLLNEYTPFAVECAFLSGPALWSRTSTLLLPPPLESSSAVAAVARSFTLVAAAHRERASLEFSDHAAALRGQRVQARSRRGVYQLRCEPWDLKRSKKGLYFAVRILNLGAELLETGTVADRTGGVLSLKHKLLEVGGEDWESHWAVAHEHWEQGLQRLCAAAGKRGVDVTGLVEEVQ